MPVDHMGAETTKIKQNTASCGEGGQALHARPWRQFKTHNGQSVYGFSCGQTTVGCEMEHAAVMSQPTHGPGEIVDMICDSADVGQKVNRHHRNPQRCLHRQTLSDRATLYWRKRSKEGIYVRQGESGC